MAASSGSDVVVDSELNGDSGGLVVADWIAVEVAWLEGRPVLAMAQARQASFRATAVLAEMWLWPRSTMSRRYCSASWGSRRRATLAAW